MIVRLRSRRGKLDRGYVDHGSSSNTLDRHCDALSHSDAHGGKGQASTEFFQLMRGRHHQTSATHAKRMPQRDGSAGRIHMVGVIGQTELTQARKRLTGKCLVELNPVEGCDSLV